MVALKYIGVIGAGQCSSLTYQLARELGFEIALALKLKKPVVGLETWRDIEGVTYVSVPQEAIQKISDLN